ncbi:hypothetical protein Anapl_17603 [Anas platyrhynchos]|uniref:Uncharacterized protein n=1 Tax=Anas platyrhynchos TaxID=8839 RepID=R0KWZ7_ANAPL|nr:hypothetical protein Anapl_17603 [Anas platyrhynchos]
MSAGPSPVGVTCDPDEILYTERALGTVPGHGSANKTANKRQISKSGSPTHEETQLKTFEEITAALSMTTNAEKCCSVLKQIGNVSSSHSVLIAFGSHEKLRENHHLDTRQPAPSTSSPQVTTPSGLQAVAQRSGFSKAEREEEEVRRGRSEDEQLSRVASAAIRLAGSFYKLLEEALETAISKSSTLKAGDVYTTHVLMKGTHSAEEEILSAATANITKIKPVCLSLPDNHYYAGVFLNTLKSACHESLLIFTKSSFVLPFTRCIYKHFPERVSGMQKQSDEGLWNATLSPSRTGAWKRLYPLSHSISGSGCILSVIPLTPANYLYGEAVSVREFLKDLPLAVQFRRSQSALPSASFTTSSSCFPQSLQLLTASNSDPSFLSAPPPVSPCLKAWHQSTSNQLIAMGQPTPHLPPGETYGTPSAADCEKALQGARLPSHPAGSSTSSLQQGMGRSLCGYQGASHHVQTKHLGQLPLWEHPHLL